MATAIATFLHSIDGGGVGQGIHSVSNSQHPLAYIHHALVFNSTLTNSNSAASSVNSVIHPSAGGNIVSGTYLNYMSHPLFKSFSFINCVTQQMAEEEVVLGDSLTIASLMVSAPIFLVNIYNIESSL